MKLPQSEEWGGRRLNWLCWTLAAAELCYCWLRLWNFADNDAGSAAYVWEKFCRCCLCCCCCYRWWLRTTLITAMFVVVLSLPLPLPPPLAVIMARRGSQQRTVGRLYYDRVYNFKWRRTWACEGLINNSDNKIANVSQFHYLFLHLCVYLCVCVCVLCVWISGKYPEISTCFALCDRQTN